MQKTSLGLLVLAALLPGQGQTLGLGEIELKSALNQELNAEIQILSAVPEDAEQLIVKLASRDAFARAGVDRPYFLQQLKFKVLVKDNKPYVRVFTKNAVREPFLSFLVEIDWPEGHMLREYTLLLDPPVYSGIESAAPSSDGGRPFIDPADQSYVQPGASQPDMWRPAQQYEQPAVDPAQNRPQVEAQVLPEVEESYSATGEVTYRPLPQARRPVSQTSRPMPQARPLAGNHRVQKHDTLWSIASRSLPNESVSVPQMMLALVRENPEAFINGNINGVKQGYILRMPDMNAINRVSRQQAIAQAREHAALWREYRQSMMASTPASAIEPSILGDDGVKPDAPDVEGKLSIVSASAGKGSEADIAGQDPNAEVSRLKSQLSLAREALESERLEKENLKARLNELEERVTSVLEMGDSDLAKLQQDLKGTIQDAGTTSAPAPVEALQPEMPDMTQAEMPAEPGVIELPAEPAVADDATSEAAVAEEITTDGPGTVEDVQMPAVDEEPIFIDETRPAEPAAAQVSDVAPAPSPVMPDTAAPAFVQKKPKTLIEEIMDQPSMLGAIGGGILAIIALIALVIRRRRLNKSAADEWMPETGAGDESLDLDEALADDATLQMTAMDLASEKKTSAAASDIDRGLNDTVTELAGSVDQAATEEEQDDVLAEADVYLAYGIYQQAEDLLKNAIQQNPDRDDYRMKLLETHYAAKDADAFAGLAQDVKGRKGGDQEYWGRVAAMGHELCPGNGLFEGVAGAVAADALIPQKPESTDLDLDMGDVLDDLGLGDMDSDATQVLSEPLDLDSVASDSADDMSGDLEFDLGDLESGIEDTATDDAALDMGDDFALDLEASDLGLAETAAEPEMDLSMDMDSSDFASANEDMSLDLDSAGDGDGLSLDLDSADDGLSLDLDAGDASLDLDAGDELDLSMDFDSGGDDTSLEMSDDSEMDLSMDMDSSDFASADEDMSLDMDSADDSLSLDMDTGDDGALDLSIDMETGSDDEISLDMDDGGDVELDFSMDDSGAAELSLGDGDDDFDISALSDDVDEVATKLELARAYIEMGDKEGAKSILDEVKEEGDSAQQQEAETLLQQAS